MPVTSRLLVITVLEYEVGTSTGVHQSYDTMKETLQTQERAIIRIRPMVEKKILWRSMMVP